MKYFQFAAVMLLALHPLASANAQAVLDQSDTVGFVREELYDPVAQTFTVGITGKLSSVELEVTTQFPTGASAANMDVQIATTAGGLPTSTILGQSIVNPGLGDFEQWITFNFSSGISVNAGETLAIVVQPPSSVTYPSYTYAWVEWGFGGQLFRRPRV